MNWLVATFAFTFAVAVALTVMVRAIARRCGVVDRPDGKRKLHKGPVARWGGVAVYLAFGMGLMVAGCGSFGVGRPLTELSAVLVITAGIVCFVGAIDDCWCLNSRLKLALQIVAVLPIVAFGYWIDQIVVFGIPIHFGVFGAPLTVLWLVGCINSLNLLDGMDGLASMVGLLTAAMLAIIAHNMGHDHVALIALVLAATLAGFLVHNLPPASIFLGDSGSMVIGLMLGVLGLQGALKTSTTLAITVPAVIMTVPMFDTALAILRRKLTGRSFAAPDREHIHHRLLDLGLTPWQALWILAAIVLTTGGAATAATIFRSDVLAWIIAVGLLVLVVRLRLFGHHEVALVKTALGRGMLALVRRLTGISVVSPTGSPQVEFLGDFDRAWGLLIDEAKARHAVRVELIVTQHAGDLWRCAWNDAVAPTPSDTWSLAMSFAAHDGRCCELRVAGHRELETEIASGHLTGLVKSFVASFAGAAAPMTSPAVAGQVPAALEVPTKSKAA